MMYDATQCYEVQYIYANYNIFEIRYFWLSKMKKYLAKLLLSNFLYMEIKECIV